MERRLDPENLRSNEDWEGNNVSFTCPLCKKVFIVSELIHKGERGCPECGQSKGKVRGGRKSEGIASIEWK